MKSMHIFLFLIVALQSSCANKYRIRQDSLEVCGIAENISFYSGRIVRIRAEAAPGINFDMVLRDDNCQSIIILRIKKEDENNASVQSLMSSLFSRRPGELPGTPSDARVPVVVEGKLVWQPENRMAFLVVDNLVIN